MLKYRAISFPVLIGLLTLMIFWQPWGAVLFVLAAPLAAYLVLREAGEMLERIGCHSFIRTTAWAGAGVFLFFAGHRIVNLFSQRGVNNGLIFLLLAMLLMVFLVYRLWLLLLFCDNKEENLRKALTSTGILVVVGVPLMLMYQLYFKTDGTTALLFFYFILVTKMMDTGGYIFGMLSARLLPGGNHKIVPSLSPKKSWEGFCGGLLLSVATSLAFYYWLPVGFFLEIGFYLTAGVVLGVGSFAGDLTESALKRVCGVKDSGRLIPGMGGMFDVVDSFLFNSVLIWLLIDVFF